MRIITPALIVLAFTALVTGAPATEIYKCTDAEGGVVYTQTPCEEERLADTSKEADEPSAEADAESTETVELAPEVVIDAPDDRTEEEIAACKKQYRDAIDAIDARLARDFDPEKADEYKQELLELTRQLRRC